MVFAARFGGKTPGVFVAWLMLWELTTTTPAKPQGFVTRRRVRNPSLTFGVAILTHTLGGFCHYKLKELPNLCPTSSSLILTTRF